MESNSPPVGKNDVLKCIKECAEKAKEDNTGVKRINIYYTGHSNKQGSFIYPNGEVTL